MNEEALVKVLNNYVNEAVNLKLEVAELKIQNDMLREELVKKEKESTEKEGE